MRATLLFISPILVALAIACGGDSTPASDMSGPEGSGNATSAGASQPTDLPGTATDLPMVNPEGPAVSGLAQGGGSGSAPGPGMTEPPVVKVAAGSNGVVAGIGSYCWGGLCLDSTGPVTDATALQVAPGGDVTMYLTFDTSWQEVQALPAAGSPKTLANGDLLWNFPPVGGTVLDITATGEELTFTAPSRPGQHVVIVFLQAAGGGDVSYGILLDVR